MNQVMQLTPARCTRKLSVDEVLAGKFPAGHIGEVKEDDCRYLLHINPFGDGKNVLTSRRISVETGRFVEKQDWCPFIRDHVFHPKLRGFVLDGGIFKRGLVSTDVVHAMREGHDVSYVCWDVLYAGRHDMRALPQKNRWVSLDEISKRFPSWLKPSERHTHPTDLLKTVLARKGEGIVLKDPNASYGQGWTKVKKKQTFDVIILGYNKPTSEIYASKGWIGQIICGQIEHHVPPAKQLQRVCYMEDGATIRLKKERHIGTFCRYVANVKNMTDELRAEISANPDKYIGRVLELSAQEQLKSGKLRNPSVVSLRDDKNPIDCILRIGDEA